MEIKNWYKLTFEIEANLEEIIIWKLNELGIFSYAFEIFLNNKNKKKSNNLAPIFELAEKFKN